MALNKVMKSVEAPGGDRCVDIFRRDDGSWGFEEYRRDTEDGRGWFPIGCFANQRFADATAAENAAVLSVLWLEAGSDGSL